MTKCCNFHITDVFLVYGVGQGQMKRLLTNSPASLCLIHDRLFGDCRNGKRHGKLPRSDNLLLTAAISNYAYVFMWFLHEVYMMTV
jgi:hypothetical protein